MTASEISTWMRGMVRAYGHGGVKHAADMLGIKPNAAGYLLHRSSNGLHEPTVMAIAWLLETQSDKFADWQIEKVDVINGYEYEHRVNPATGERRICWRVEEQQYEKTT